MLHSSGGNLDEEIIEAGAAPPAIPQSPKSGLLWVFVGADGIRAGWGVLLFVLLYLVFIFFTGWALRPFLQAIRLTKVLPVKLAVVMEVPSCYRQSWRQPSWHASRADLSWGTDSRGRQGPCDSFPAWCGGSLRSRCSCLFCGRPDCWPLTGSSCMAAQSSSTRSNGA